MQRSPYLLNRLHSSSLPLKTLRSSFISYRKPIVTFRAYAKMADSSTSTQSHACCTVPPVVDHDYKEKGNWDNVNGLKTYITGKSTAKRRNGPQPLRLPPGKLFFGYEIKPMKKKEGEEGESGEKDKKQHFSGDGNTLRKKK